MSRRHASNVAVLVIQSAGKSNDRWALVLVVRRTKTDRIRHRSRRLSNHMSLTARELFVRDVCVTIRWQRRRGVQSMTRSCLTIASCLLQSVEAIQPMRALAVDDYDAVEIEYGFAYFFEEPIGKRSGAHDADAFRGGEYADLGELLEKFAAHFRKRLGRLRFSPDEERGGGAKANLDASIDSIERMGTKIKGHKGREPDDYHWEIIGDLVHAIAALLDHLEGKGAPRIP